MIDKVNQFLLDRVKTSAKGGGEPSDKIDVYESLKVQTNLNEDETLISPNLAYKSQSVGNYALNDFDFIELTEEDNRKYFE